MASKDLEWFTVTLRAESETCWIVHEGAKLTAMSEKHFVYTQFVYLEEVGYCEKNYVKWSQCSVV